MLLDFTRYIALAAAVLLILLSWILLQAHEPNTLPDLFAAEQRTLAFESCDSDTPCVLEMKDLLRMADVFDGTYVSTTGFLILEFEGNGLYLSRAAYQSGNSRNAIWVNLKAAADEASQLSGTHVSLVGRFHGVGDGKGTYGHEGVFGAEIDVDSVTVR